MIVIPVYISSLLILMNRCMDTWSYAYGLECVGAERPLVGASLG